MYLYCTHTLSIRRLIRCISVWNESDGRCQEDLLGDARKLAGTLVLHLLRLFFLLSFGFISCLSIHALPFSSSSFLFYFRAGLKFS